MGFFLSNFFTSPRAATIIGYLLVFASVAIALLLELLKVNHSHELLTLECIMTFDLISQPLYLLYRYFQTMKLHFLSTCFIHRLSSTGNVQDNIEECPNQ